MLANGLVGLRKGHVTETTIQCYGSISQPYLLITCSAQSPLVGVTGKLEMNLT